jgi:hypothetical protein
MILRFKWFGLTSLHPLVETPRRKFINMEKTTQSPKPQYTQISLLHKRELTTKREKLYFFHMPLAATKLRKEVWVTMLSNFSPPYATTLNLLL